VFKVPTPKDVFRAAYDMFRGRSHHDMYEMPDFVQQPHIQKTYDGQSIPGNVNHPQTPGNPQHGFSSEPIGHSEVEEQEPQEEQQEEVDEYDPNGINEEVINQEFEDFHGRSIDHAMEDPSGEEMDDDEMEDPDLEEIVEDDPAAEE